RGSRMNLPSSLALPQSKLFQSRIFLVLLLVLAVLIGAGVFYFMRPLTPPKAPTVATSPAAQAIPRPTPAASVAPVPAPIVYGPPAPDWVERVPMPAAAPAPAPPVPPPIVSAPPAPDWAERVPMPAAPGAPAAQATALPAGAPTAT